MHIIDLAIFIAYMAAMLGVGLYFYKKNSSTDDYYVGGRNLGSMHVGLSVVATDVGGGFSIGLGGLGFTMGLSGSWMLFTGLIGAWVAAVVLIPTVSRLAKEKQFLTFPQLFEHFYDRRVALAAGVISAIGYLGFTSSQILAGAKLASASFESLDMTTALVIMGVIAVVYTVMGGIKAVIYTDTIQWIILMAGLIFIGLPMGYYAIGGYSAIVETLNPAFVSLGNVAWYTIVNWGITIIPIWFVGMTLYQRIYACGDEKVAKRAWFIAGLFEWPVMAFMGVTLGLFARVAAEQGMFEAVGYAQAADLDAELGLPLLLRSILPVGLMGLMMSAYFSAIMSTADSCLMAASGNLLTDVLGKWTKHMPEDKVVRFGQLLTLVVGVAALAIALFMTNVLELMLHSYAFMVSGLLIPVLAALFIKKAGRVAAFVSMITGGATTLMLIALEVSLPFQLDANIYGIMASLVVFLIINKFETK